MSTGPQQPYASPTPGSFGPPPKKSYMGCIIAAVALFVGGGALVCCGGGGGFVYFSLNLLSTQIEKQLRANPVVAEHLGEVKKCTYNMTATGERHAPGSNEFVFDIEGTKGSGQVDLKAAQDLTIISGKLRTPTGAEVSIMPGGPFDGIPSGIPGMPMPPKF